MVNNAANKTSRALGKFSERTAAGKISQLQKKGKDGFFLPEQLHAEPDTMPAAAVSQNYASAGNVLPLRGLHNGLLYYNNPADAVDGFIQHHATTYRRLLETMYEYPPTAEDTAGLVESPVVAIAD
jgi:hypothetical protein